MKIIKTANGQKIKMSKKEWQSIGKKAGWMKKAQGYYEVELGELDKQLGEELGKNNTLAYLVETGKSFTPRIYKIVDEMIDFHEKLASILKSLKEDSIKNEDASWNEHVRENPGVEKHVRNQ